MNKLVQSVLTVVAVFVLLLAIQFIVSLIRSTPFDPRWIETSCFSVFAGLLNFFGPDAEQRKKNREKLAKMFKK